MIIDLKKLVKSSILLAFLLSNPAWSQNDLLAIGEIDEIGSNYVIITDSKFKILPTAKVYLGDKKPGRMENLNKGDFVKLYLLKINRIEQVEAIHKYDNPEQLLKSLQRN